MISTLKLMTKSFLDNHQLLSKAIQFSAGKGLGFSFDPKVITCIFLLETHKKYSNIVRVSFFYFIWF